MPCTPNQSSAIGSTIPQATLEAVVSNMDVALATDRHDFRNNCVPVAAPGEVVRSDRPGRSHSVANSQASVEGDTAADGAPHIPVPFTGKPEMDKKDAARHLSAVPTPAPGSLTPEQALLLLKKGNPTGPYFLECSKARPYLMLISRQALAKRLD
jgi:hypothetical protein